MDSSTARPHHTRHSRRTATCPALRRRLSGRHKLILKYFLKYFKLNKTNPQMGDNVLHARLVTIHHCFSAVFKKELNIRRCRLIAIRRDDHVLILEA